MVKRLTMVLGACAALSARAAEVPVPELPMKWYTGELQTAVVPESPAYTVIVNAGGTDAGEYDVVLELVNPGDVWVDASGVLPDTVAFVFWEIARTPNAWTRAPSITGWTWGESVAMPDAAAKFGTVKVRYSGTTANGVTVTDALSVTAAGDYTATFTVDETENYFGLSESVAFTVARGTLSGGGASGGAQIAASGYAGVYDGAAHSISVEITNAQPGESFTVTYSTDGTVYAAEAPQFTTLGTYTVWYRVESDSYATVENSETVTIAKKEITPPAITPMTYTGAAQTADVPTSADWTVLVPVSGTVVDEYLVWLELTDKVNTKWATTDEEVVSVPFVITKAENDWTVTPNITGWTYGEAANVPTGAAKFGVVMVTYSGTTAAGAVIENATSVTAAGSYTATFSVAATADYDGLTETVAFSIAPATISGGGSGGGASLAVSGWEGEYDGAAHSITVAVTGAAEGDVFLVSYATDAAGPFGAENPVFVDPGSYTVWYRVESESYATAEGSATVVITEPPPPACAELTAEIGWKYLKATGTWFAQVRVTCTDGLAAGIDNLRFLFADRTDGDGTLRAALWSSAPADRCAVKNTMAIDEVIYRYVDLDATKIAAEDSEVVFGVGDLGAATIPTAERGIELYVAKRVEPNGSNADAAGVDNFVGYLVWDSGGSQHTFAVVADAAASKAVAKLSASRASVGSAAPVGVSRLNTSLAVGVPLAEGSSPYCALTAFAVDGDTISGTVEVGAADGDGARTPGTLGANARVTLIGAETLGGKWTECGTVAADADGGFTLPKPERCAFFKVRIEVVPVVE